MTNELCIINKSKVEPYVYDANKTSFFGNHYKNKPLYKRINYLHLLILSITPILSIYGLLTCDYYLNTFLFTILYYVLCGFGITAGYHRLFAHKSYEAHPSLEIALMCLGSGSVQGSLKWWARDHRAHHKYVDSDKDPYSSKLGFWHSHIGWMLIKQEKERIGNVNISDLTDKWYVKHQHEYYGLYALLFGLLLPTLICGLFWGDYYGGFYIAGITRLVLLHHATFCVNSLAHWNGEQTYSDGHSAKNSFITALVTLGEGYHNFHHEFPNDYRNAIKWWQYDPTKWFIKTLNIFGLTSNLITHKQDNIKKGELQMQHKGLLNEMSNIYWGENEKKLKSINKKILKDKIKNGEKLIIYENYIYDVSDFIEKHPGGKNIILNNIGNDVTNMFNYEVYKHSNAAHNLLNTYKKYIYYK